MQGPPMCKNGPTEFLPRLNVTEGRDTVWSGTFDFVSAVYAYLEPFPIQAATPVEKRNSLYRAYVSVEDIPYNADSLPCN